MWQTWNPFCFFLENWMQQFSTPALERKVSYGSWHFLIFIVNKFLSFRKSGIFFKFPLRKFCYFHFDLLEWKLAFSNSNMLFRCLSDGVWCHKNIINFKNISIWCLTSLIGLFLHFIQVGTFHDENNINIELIFQKVHGIG